MSDSGETSAVEYIDSDDEIMLDGEPPFCSGPFSCEGTCSSPERLELARWRSRCAVLGRARAARHTTHLPIL